ncbi:hypothetical protein B0O80DRAFT_472500 [Mortierella sp. GBAus27b]|nr:hypothetical protein B0O80DRAFT_472500 [Mortierella sp. GBAus27b]
MTYSGTDYGLKKMSVTVPMSHNAIITHLNRFHALGTLDPDDPPPKLEELRIPDPIIITAPQVNSISYATKASRNRERRLKQDRNSEVRTSLEELGNLQVPLRHATTMESIDEALATTRRVSETIQSFESSPANVKDGHTRALRTKRAWSKIAAHERSIIKNHEQVTSPPPTDPRSRNVIPIMLTGTAGTCIGSRIKGSAKRGGGKLREEHRKHAIVGMTNEYCSSKTCIFCFARTRLAKATRTINGGTKTRRLNGSVECYNPGCPSRSVRYTIKARDPHAAAAIALAGASCLLSPNHRTISPFTPQYRPHHISNTTNNTSTIAGSHTCSQHPDDALGAPPSEEA